MRMYIMAYTSVGDYEYNYLKDTREFTVYLENDDMAKFYQNELSVKHNHMAIYLHERLLS